MEKTEQGFKEQKKELLFSGGAGALCYEMGYAHRLIEIVGKEKLQEYYIGGVSSGAACAGYFYAAINTEYDMKYWYENSGRKFYEPSNKKFFGFLTTGSLIYNLGESFYSFMESLDVPALNTKVHIAATSVEGFGHLKRQVFDNFENANDFAEALVASCFLPGIVRLGLYTTYKGKKMIDGGLTTPVPYKFDDSKKILINVLPCQWPFLRVVPDNTEIIDICKPFHLSFPLDYWLWGEQWSDEMFDKGYLAAEMQREIIEKVFKD
jgi:predicted acylesterase/phospholipase RssA